MENPTEHSAELGNFHIVLNENGSITVFTVKGSLLIKPLSGSSTILYTSSTGKSPQVKHDYNGTDIRS